MHAKTTSRMLIVGVATLSLSLLAEADTPKAPAKTSPTDSELINSAMSAAPGAVGKDATVVAMGADGKMRTLRKGTNGFTCMPDDPATPGADPMCADANAMEWIHALMGHKTPAAGKVGLMGADTSFYSQYPKAADPDTSVPYMMWPGTPYQHLMAPTK